MLIGNKKKSVPIEIQDQSSDIVDVFMCQKINSVTLSAKTVIDSKSCNLVGGHGVVAGNILCFKYKTRFMQARVLSVVTDTINLDMPFDFAYPTTAIVDRSTHEMAVNGSVTPQVFRVTPVGTTNKFDINRIVFYIQDDVIMDTSKFGGLPELTNGIVVRKKDGKYKNIFNAKSNGQLAYHCQEHQYEDKAPAGQYELTAHKIFNGQQFHGNVIRLDYSAGDEIQVIIQDNLTGLSDFHCIVHGHVVQD